MLYLVPYYINIEGHQVATNTFILNIVLFRSMYSARPYRMRYKMSFQAILEQSRGIKLEDVQLTTWQNNT